MRERTISYTSGTSDKPLFGTTIGDMFDHIAGIYADKEALIVRRQNIRYTYAELKTAVDACARSLMALGINKGDRVGICSPNNAEWAVVQFATAKVGAILVNINPSYRTHELKYALKQSGCCALVIAAAFKTSNYIRMIREICPELSSCDAGRLHSETLPGLRTVVHLGAQPESGMYTWQDVMAMADRVTPAALAERQASLEFDDPINIQYTSGTTGYPKGATLSHHNILNNGYFVTEIMNFTDADRLVIPVPLYHCFGMVMGNLGCVTHGATMIYPCDGFDPGEVLRAVEEEKATALYGVPTMFIAELEHPDFESFSLSSLRTGIMAGSPCPVEVMKKVITLMNMSGVEIAYGMTETSPVSCQTRADAPLDKRVETVGQIHPHLEVKIVDPDTGAVVPTGATGELCTRGYSVMLRYWDNEEATRQAIDPARWMHTGDLAVMDGQGYVKIVGRIKDMVIRGGENVYPREIEEFLYSNPKVRDVQVIGVPDEKYGEEIMAWVVLREGEDATPEELRAFCKDKIAHYKIPRFFKFVEEFPMTVTGKVQKFKMRETAAEEMGLKN